jgi:REP element-mobilizing transposase RayT
MLPWPTPTPLFTITSPSARRTANRGFQRKSNLEVWAYIGGIARAHKMTALQIGGVEDHIHAVVVAPPSLSPSQMAQCLKGDSSKWIHEEFPKLRGFDWAGRLRRIHGQQVSIA